MKKAMLRLLSASLCCLLLTAPLKAQSPAGPAKSFAITNVTVIDGNGGAPRPGMTLLISGGRVADVFPAGRKRLPAGVTVMDLSGSYVMPGLIDSHYHIIPRAREEQTARLRFALLGGVTAVREMAGDARVLSELAKSGDDGAVQSPRVYFSALMAGPAWFVDERVKGVSPGLPPGGAAWARAVTAETDVARAVAEARATGATGVKMYADLPPELVARITKEAHRRGLKVWSHAAIFPSSPGDAVAAGVDVISHSVDLAFETSERMPASSQEASRQGYRSLEWGRISADSPAVTALLKRMGARGTMLDDTVIHTHLRLVPALINRESARPEAERKTGYPPLVDEWAFAVTRRAHQLGVPLVAGTDFQEQPRTQDFPNIHTEMELLVNRCGLTPLEAITAATRNGAKALGVENLYGTVVKGKVADLIVLSADPSRDIRNTTSIVFVVKGGTLHKRERVTMPAS